MFPISNSLFFEREPFSSPRAVCVVSEDPDALSHVDSARSENYLDLWDNQRNVATASGDGPALQRRRVNPRYSLSDPCARRIADLILPICMRGNFHQQARLLTTLSTVSEMIESRAQGTSYVYRVSPQEVSYLRITGHDHFAGNNLSIIAFPEFSLPRNAGDARSGSYKCLYRCWSPSLQKPVAALHLRLNNDVLCSSCRISYDLHNDKVPNVPQVYGFLRVLYLDFLVQELFEDDLYWCSRPKKNSRPESIPKLRLSHKFSICKSIAKTLAALHEKRLAHLDIKTANVLIDFDGGIPRVALTDFDFMQSADCVSHFGGTHFTLPPDVLKECLDAKLNDTNPELDNLIAIDLWALGILFLDIMTKNKSCDINHLIDVVNRFSFSQVKIKSTVYNKNIMDAIQSCLDSITEVDVAVCGLKRIITRLFARDPAQRPAAATVYSELVALEPDAALVALEPDTELDPASFLA